MTARFPRTWTPLTGGWRPRARAIAAVAVACVLLAGFGAGRGIGTSAALLTSSKVVAGNAFTAGTWSNPVTWYLHNNPTPPVGNTTAQASLAMDTTVPVAATLYNYDTNVDSAVGRRLTLSGSGPGESAVGYYAAWRTGVLASARPIVGTVVVRLWSATQSFTRNRAGSIVAYVRDYNPTTATYVEIANATLTNANWQGGQTSWVPVAISIAVASYTVPVGHRIEIKVEATSAAALNMWIAYDTSSYASSIDMP